MRKYFLFVATLAALIGQPTGAAAQKSAKPVYMQIFYAGTSWLADQPLLHYSPAFRGKVKEIVREDSTRVMAPGALVFDAPYATLESESIITGKGTLVRGSDGKMRPQTPADIQKGRLAEKERFSRSFKLLSARAALAHNTLTKALNDAAADGWEVVQVASTGNGGGLVYLLRRR